MGRKTIDLKGRKIGKLTVIEYIGTKGKEGYWLCKCDCGKEKTYSTSRLNNNRVKSCGCIIGDNLRKHNMKYTRLYTIWCGMKQRCVKGESNYKNVTYCDEWKEFTPFYEWAIANGYNDELTIDRIDTFGNYEPGNCRWVSQKVQQNNRSNNTLITYNNCTHTLSEWADITKIGRSTISARLLKLGWSIEEALTTELQGGKNARRFNRSTVN